MGVSPARPVSMQPSLRAPKPPPPHVLIVDDDPEIRDLLADYLESAGLRASTAADGDAMWTRLGLSPVDLVVLDVMLPGVDGLALCRELRRDSQMPVIMLTARGQATDRIAGLEIGADDYMAKPFEPRELLARIRGVLRRSAGGEPRGSVPARQFRFAGWTLDTVTRQMRAPDGRIVSLGGADYRLLRVLLQSPNRPIDRDTLIDHVYGRDRAPVDRAIDVCVSRLRQHLGDDARKPMLIRTMRNEGYLLSADVDGGD